jgi:hypothetical protein
MTDPTNDIDALLTLTKFGGEPYHATAKALVAERNALKQRVAELERFNSTAVRIISERDGLREQLRLCNIDQFNTEAEANDRDRELRERLVCAIWPQMLRSFDQLADDFGNRNTWRQAKDIARSEALKEADEMIAAMRKGDQDEK